MSVWSEQINVNGSSVRKQHQLSKYYFSKYPKLFSTLSKLESTVTWSEGDKGTMRQEFLSLLAAQPIILAMLFVKTRYGWKLIFSLLIYEPDSLSLFNPKTFKARVNPACSWTNDILIQSVRCEFNQNFFIACIYFCSFIECTYPALPVLFSIEKYKTRKLMFICS